MLFSSFIFLQIFLPCTFAGALLFRKRGTNFFLLLASLLFYAWGEPSYVFLLLASTAANYFIGLFIGQASASASVDKKAGLGLGIGVNIALLAHFKYMNFFVFYINSCVPGLIPQNDPIALPIGISFYTFQAISYLVDVYRGQVKAEKNFISLTLYIAFFPQLIAGPIIKFHDISEQLKHRAMTLSSTAIGIRRFIFGLSKKVLIADTLAIVADSIFSTSPQLLTPDQAWFGLIAYTLQIYFDFSGYSDMAIGLGKMFGFDYLENFNYPYMAASVRDFWRRWHISLSTWFKEYLYIPLGGSRCGKWRTGLNLLVVFFLTGLWHGASWNFVVWGLFHGIFLMTEHFLARERSFAGSIYLRMLSHVYTLLVVVTGWVFFRAETLEKAFCYLKAMFVPSGTDAASFSLLSSGFFCPRFQIVLAAAVLLCGPFQLLPGVKRYLAEKSGFYWFDLPLLTGLLFFSMISLGANTYNPFIYFRF